jgi:hypothetical protein
MGPVGAAALRAEKQHRKKCVNFGEREREREKERKKVREREREQQQHGRRQSLDLLLLEPEREFEGGVGGRRGTGGGHIVGALERLSRKFSA